MNDGLMLGGGIDERLKAVQGQDFFAENENSGETFGQISGHPVSEIQYRLLNLSVRGDQDPQKIFHQLIAKASEQASALGCHLMWAQTGGAHLALFLEEGFVQLTSEEDLEGGEEPTCFVLKSLRDLREVSREARELNQQRRKLFEKVPERQGGESLWGRAEKFSRLFSRARGPQS